MTNQLEKLSRRDSLKLGAKTVLAVTAATFTAPAILAQDNNKQPPREFKRPAPLDNKLVGEFIGACHRNLDKVKTMLKQEPGLVNASFDFGGGDYERGMEAAAHMGRADIADVLIEYKARKCIFWAAMAGEEDIVKAFVLADPSTVHTGGAHKISLMAHAAICGKTSLTQFLLENGARVNRKSLEHAVRGNQIDMVEWLVENGANPAAKSFRGTFLYEEAEKQGLSEIAKFLRDRASS